MRLMLIGASLFTGSYFFWLQNTTLYTEATPVKNIDKIQKIRNGIMTVHNPKM